mmetsp:Transcript_10465/g.7811  ORF Transcript_10465/g.7811 Transcript_10465/m.7811 type:complete len:177 (+) Transcript_10465:27-557(+)|eukprot:CAMPEP_0202971906 /NCGR_PEP_ID=MMETSP1396-20130829/32039_1 /ASSEMBLY_ACC=CAM_ASM_000872 /TAXON_ID= /ORGANISM="Pseudokeronopsis sp., Strain Brazil" /LENGTH=176 /DNA_ID=CAMNT_0049701785 /DNA_START=6 /DNA_END=536 /DNA_ORIENTATION=+
MADEEQPAWLRTGNAGSSPSTSPSSSAVNSASSANAPPFKNVVKMIFLVMNIGLMIFMAATGALGIGGSDNVNDTGVVFVGIYLILFAGILCLFEISQLCPGGRLDEFVKRNFGFLYGNVGKGLFLLFVGILCFGLTTPRSMAIACGVLVAAWGCASILITMKWPEYFDKKEKFTP